MPSRPCGLFIFALIVGCGDGPVSESLAAPSANALAESEDEIDLRPYFISSHMPGHVNPVSRYFVVSDNGAHRLRAHVKWNQPDNYELFVDDGEYIYARYEENMLDWEGNIIELN